MTYTAFKAGDKVSWNSTKAIVLEDSDSKSDSVFVYFDGDMAEWKKVLNIGGEVKSVVKHESI